MIRIFSGFLLILLLSSYNVAQTANEISEKPLYRPTGNEAALVGSISVEGPIPMRRRIDMSADPICLELNPKPETDDVIVSENRLRNAFVYLKSDALQWSRFELPASEITLQHINCVYSPHVLGLRVGQTLRIINADPTHHNTHPTPRNNQEWNVSQSYGGDGLGKTFSREEVLIPVKDNAHPWERAFVAVLSHPFFAVSDDFGRFEIRGVPPGTYKLVVWHERFGEQQLEVTVVPNEIRNADFTFATEKKKP
jgi:hypothetical protein